MRPFPDPRAEQAEALYAPSDIVRSRLCTGCGTCAAANGIAAMEWDRDGFLKPDGPREWLEQPSEVFSHQCPFSPAAANEDAIAAERFDEAPHANAHIGRFEAAYVGYAVEDPFRQQASSGGLTS